jgi:hypothetical protein
MKSIFLFFSLSACLIATSQSNLSIFNNSGQRFYVILNGIKQNSMAQTNVSVSGIKDGGYSVKLIFEDGKTPDIDKNFFIDSPSDITTKVVFKKGKGKLQLVSMLPTSGAIQNNSVTYRPNDTFIYSDQQAITTNQTNVSPINGNGSNQTVNTTTNSNAQISNGNSQVNTTNTTITSGNSQSTSSNQNTSGNVNMNVSTNGANVSVTDPTTNGNIQLNMGLNMNDPINGNLNMNVNIGGMNGVQTNSSSTTTTTTTTTSSQTINGTTTNQSGSTTTQNNNGNVNVTTSGTPSGNVTFNSGATTGNANSTNSTVNTNSSNQNNSNNGYNGNNNCTKTLVDFNGFMKDLKSQSFEDDKMETIKLDLQKTCLTHAQAYQIIESLTFEENRFEIAKYLYARTLDKQLSEKGMLPLFTFDSTKMDWREFVRNYR